MKLNSKVSRISAAVALAVGLSTSAFAQETSSSMRGVITGPQGNPAANTKVVIIHQPTGTVNEFTTNEDGVFSAKGLRVGGPYQVVLDSDKYRDAVLEGVYLDLGDTFRVSRQLESADMERLVVSGSAIMMESGGASSSFGEDTIDNMPSLNRDLKDVARINPLVTINGSGEMTIAGGDPRMNSITVDGIGQNDDFGLNYGGYPTEQSPVALSAIEQISVDAAPFSVKKGDFSGGTINAVTKSGTNEFEGELFYEYSSPDLKGDVEQIREIRDEDDDPVLDENGYRTYRQEDIEPNRTISTLGLSFGGPIVKDSLFFFTSYEEWTNEIDLDYGFQGSGATNEFYVSEELYNDFIRILDEQYGIQDSLGGDPEDKDRKWLTKLSWNINQAHRFDVTYQWQDNSDARNFATGETDQVTLASSRYTYHTRMNNISARLYSDWTSNFITEMGLTYKDVEANSLTNSNLGQVTVEESYRGPSFVFGRDKYRHSNVAKNDNLTFNFDATYLMGEHEIVFGAQVEQLSLYNKFVPDSLGTWEFDNFYGFENGIVGNFRGSWDFDYQNAYTNNPEDAAYEVERTTLALYAGDTFYVTPNLEINAGLRYERLSSSDTPTLNENFQEAYDGMTNQENLDGLDIFLPRFSFKYYTDSSLVVRGGLGRFYGGVPNVWYTNPFTKDGVTLVQAPASVIADYYENNTVNGFDSVPQEIQDAMERGNGSTNYTDPNFELPSDWRAQLALDYELDIPYLGDMFNATTSLMYKRIEDQPVWYNTALEEAGRAADGERIIYESRYEGDRVENYDIMLTNAPEDGRAFIFSQSIAKQWNNGLNFTASYTYQDVEDNGAGSSSQAASNYKHYVAKSRNQAFTATGNFETEHSLKITLGYKKEFFADYETRFNLFFERRSGRPFSYIMGFYNDNAFGDNDAGGDYFNSQSAYLAYIPSGENDPNVDWDNSISWNELKVLLDNAGIAYGGEGYILDRNTHNQPWVTDLDLSIQQEIPGFMDGHKGILYLTIDNFANLLNDDWGIERRLTYPQVALYDFGGLSDDGKYQIDRTHQGYYPNNYSTVDMSSSWSAKLGVRYTF
jgi:hypothetical protein